jgi:hypothetical protein
MSNRMPQNVMAGSAPNGFAATHRPPTHRPAHRAAPIHRTPPPSAAEPAPPTAPASGWAAIKQTWSDPQRWIAVAVAAAPGLAFVAANALSSLYPAVIAAAVTGLIGLAYRLIRRESMKSALVGILIVAVCAAVAAVTGEARGFFLVPALIPFAVIVICLATILARRPLTGLILNRVTGGPRDWYHNRALRRVHLVATSAALGINVVNGFVQAVFYGRNDTVVLAVAHVATGPVFATLVAVTVVAVRRTLAAQKSANVDDRHRLPDEQIGRPTASSARAGASRRRQRSRTSEPTS